MLPKPNSPDFPDALKAARKAKGYNFTQLAKHCGISAVMPSRYEDRQHSNFGPPSDKTWEKLNQVLFDINLPNSVNVHGGKLIEDASIDDLIQALKDRGASSVIVTF